MKTITPQLPTILGAGAAMLIAFVSLMTGTSAGTCLMKALAAFLVFAGFGLVLRFVLSGLPEADKGSGAVDTDETEDESSTREGGQLDMILPGTTVADMLGVQSEAPDMEQSAA